MFFKKNDKNIASCSLILITVGIFPKMHFFIQNKCFNLRSELCCLFLLLEDLPVTVLLNAIYIKWFETSILRY